MTEIERRSSAVDVAVLATEIGNLAKTVQRETELATERSRTTDAKIERLDQKVDRLSFIDPQTYAADKHAMAEQRKDDLKDLDRRFTDLEKFRDKVLYGVLGAVGLAVLAGGALVTR